MNIQEGTIEEALNHLPDIEKLGSFNELKNRHFDVYMSALGFEERTLSIPENLAISSNDQGFTCDHCYYFTYETSTSDNAFNEPRLKEAIGQIKNRENQRCNVENFFCDEDNFFQLLQQKLNNLITKKGNDIDVIIDLSVCSSKLILALCKLIFELKRVNLIILYTEAALYFPLYEEYRQDESKFLNDSEMSTTSGYEMIINSNEYSEGAKESPDLVVAFASFKTGRINKIVSDIDESILLNNDKRLIWVLGLPNLDQACDCQNRMQMQKEINQIDDSALIKEVSTLDYKRTMQTLEEIYKTNVNYHMNIADLGSKMQTLAISIFYHIRPDVSVYYALPKVYHPNRYSTGIKCHWKIDFGSIQKIIENLNNVDVLNLQLIHNDNFPYFE